MSRTNKLVATIVLLLLVISSLGFVVAAGSADCVAKFTNVFIHTPPAYAVGEEFNDINLSVVSQIGGDLPYQARLFKDFVDDANEPIGADRPNGRMSNGEAVINFNYASQLPGTFIIQVEVGSGEDIVIETKEVEVRSAFELKLFCPINNFIGETINCEWNPTDLTTGQLITIDVPDARVSQGGVDLNSPISGNKLSFTTTTPGSVLVEVAGTANGYVDSVETVTVSVQDATTTIVFAVDGTDIFTLSGLGVDTKTHNLDMTITDGSLPAEVTVDRWVWEATLKVIRS